MGMPIPPPEEPEKATSLPEDVTNEDDAEEDYGTDHGNDWQEDESGSEDGWAGSEQQEWADPSGGVLLRILHAAEEGEAELLSELLQGLSVSINERGPEGDSALHLASVYGHADCVRCLLDQGASADLRDEGDATALHDAAAGGYLDIVELLYEAAPSILNSADDDGDTPLHNAARGGHFNVVQYLLDKGADPFAINKAFERPSDVADGGTLVWQILQEACARTE